MARGDRGPPDEDPGRCSQTEMSGMPMVRGIMDAQGRHWKCILGPREVSMCWGLGGEEEGMGEGAWRWGEERDKIGGPPETEVRRRKGRRVEGSLHPGRGGGLRSGWFPAGPWLVALPVVCP